MIVMGKFSFVFVLGFVLMISMQNIAVVLAQSCPAAERDALLAFKAGITEDSSGQLTKWVATTDCCTWFGILCKNGHVIELWLDGGGSGAKWGHLTGPLGSSLFTLLELEVLVLSETQNLTGPISPTIGNLTNLVRLDFRSNKLTGSIPSSVGNLKKLKWLSLGGNPITGSIPSSIGTIGDSLNNIYLGPIPPMFAKQLTGLAALGLENNQLTGPIPQGAPFSNLSVDSFTPGNPGLFGHPLPPCTGGNRKKLL
ncbi:unnamed protein product [Sphagnum tenellum]